LDYEDILWANLQSVLELLFGHCVVVCLRKGHAEMIMICGIFRVPLHGFLQQWNRGLVNALLVVGPRECIGYVRNLDPSLGTLGFLLMVRPRVVSGVDVSEIDGGPENSK